MGANEPVSGSSLTRETILAALSRLSDELGRQGVIGELCLFLIEGLFEEGKL
jgi:hypothetical protein